MDRTQFERLSGYLEDSLPASERKKLQLEVTNNAELADQLLAVAFEETVLREWAESRRDALELDEAVAREEIQWQPSSKSENVRRHRLGERVLIVSGLAIALVVGWFGWSQSPEGTVAALENVSGIVEVIHSNGTSEAVAGGRTVGVNQQLNLKGPRSTASLVYPDGSRLILAGLSRIQLEGKHGKRIRISQGQVGAMVAKQSSAESMQFLTPTAMLEVMGTQFSLETSADATDVSVIEGRVKLTRTSDGQSVELLAGSRAIAGTDQSQLVALNSSNSPATYDIDFEQGLPTGWQTGTAVREGDPLRGAVKAETFKERDGIVYGITSPKAWRDGLFSWQGNEHLNFTYKLDKPDWFQVFISTRAVATDLPPIATYRFKDERMWWPFEPGQWRTASIPLTSFGRVSDWSETPMSVGELPFELLFTSKDNNLSLVIDRLWISQDGPETFTVREEE